ncbi:hypothetical protein PKHYL_26890 [Psychrobacter sp. KH172YL61]|uniref:hypothetical protein n=1 Tax=Psychrobacter sp. KH172YL61 TaxID=2517899 RepID=UPI0010BBE33F|nr:hypothetical protein [Psychrobacter sp. KH172YL61]BBI68498.1 hypothetical protein PKHYL_26890 [Psychrobacter sp. KH172YL61]
MRWAKPQLPDGTLSQDVVDEVNKVLRPVNPADLKKVITILGGAHTGLATQDTAKSG